MKPSGPIVDAAIREFGEPNWPLSSNTELRFRNRGSLSVRVADGVWFDHELGEGGKVHVALPKPKSRRLVATYDYASADGELLFQVCRYEPKDFRQRRQNADGIWTWSVRGIELVPYRLPEMLAATEVVVVEGEKDADALAALGIVATCKPMGSGRWPAALSQYFQDKHVLVLSDNDEAGIGLADSTGRGLLGHAASVRVAYPFTDLGPKADVSDYLLRGGDVHQLLDQVRKMPEVSDEGGSDRIEPRSFDPALLKDLPRRRWIYGTHYSRGYVSALVASGGVGKTTLGLIELISIALGRDLLGVRVWERCNCWHFNLEDSVEELHRRVWAICDTFEIDPAELAGKLFLSSGRDNRLIVAREQGGVVAPTDQVEEVLAGLKSKKIGVLQVDPLIRAHQVKENDSHQLDPVFLAFTQLAHEANAAVSVVHHARKAAPGTAHTPGDLSIARGSTALEGAVREARTMTHMSVAEAERFEIPERRRPWFVRVDDAKANNARPADHAVWLEREGRLLPNGDDVGVLRPWSPPDPFEGLTPAVAHEALWEIDRGPGSGAGFLRSRRNNTNRWAGVVLQKKGFSMGNAKTILNSWFKSGLLVEREQHNPERRKDERVVRLDPSKLPGSL